MVELRTDAAAWGKQIPASQPIDALAVDPERQRLWLLSGTTLSALGLDGVPEWSFEISQPAGRAWLAVVPEDGAIWLGTGTRLSSFSATGQSLHRLELPAPIVDLSMDPERSVLWLVDATGVASFDAVSGVETQRVGSSAEVADIDVDPVTGRLWEALEGDLRLRNRDGSERFRVPAAGLEAMAADDRGHLWVAAGALLRKVGSRGDDSLDLAPFGDDARIDRLVFDPAHRAIWALSGSRLAKVSAGGEVLATLDLGEDSTPVALALYAGAPDAEPPRIDLAGKLSPHAFDPSRRTIDVGYRDLRSGVDAATLSVRLEKLDDVLECFPRAMGARCFVTADAGFERSTLVASVADHLGNVAETSMVLTAAERNADDTMDEVGLPPLDKADVLGGGSGGLAGERIPSLRGLLPNQVFLSDGDVESINTANGNVNLSIPLGQVYNVGPHIQYQLRATHNSDAWDHATVQCSHMNSGCQGIFGPAMVALPHRSTNAGLGWSVQFGQLFAPSAPTGAYTLDRQTWPNRDHASIDIGKRWLYVSPDGSSHHLYALNGRTTSHGGFPVRYAKDGSELRMRQVNTNTVIVEHPNGVISQFEKSNSRLGTTICGNGLDGCWRFKEQRDYYGNKVGVTYSQSGNHEIWRIQDSTGRVHRILFRIDNGFREGGDATTNALKMPNGDQLGDLRRVVDRVEVAAAGGTAATYQFRYTAKNVFRARPHDPDGVLAPGNERIRVPVLTKIEVPDSPDYAFTHYTDFARSGRVATVQFPTQGKYQYLYGFWLFPTACVYDNDPTVDLHYTKSGLTEKRHLNPDGSQVARWTYSTALFPSIPGDQISGPNCRRADYRRTIVNSPTIGNRFTQQRYFHAVTIGPKVPSGSDPIGDWQVTDNGLPFTKDTKIGSGNSNYLFLSEQTYDCKPNCEKERETYVRYAMSRRSCSTHLQGKDPASCFQVNPIRVRERTVFTDDSNRYREIKHTHHNGATNTRRRFTIDNFGSSTRQVEHRTNYNVTGSLTIPENPTTGYLNFGGATGSGNLPTPTQAWILTPFDHELKIDSGRTYRTNFQFDTKGSILCIRKKLSSGADSSRDVVTKFQLGASVGNNAGLPAIETMAGGENGALGAGVCNTAGSEGTNRFTFKHGYAYYSKASTQIGSFPFRYRADIDRNTGLPSATYNAADQKTSVFYDKLARPTRIAPEASLGEAETLFTYGLTGNGESDVQIERRFSGSTRFEERLIYDFFGRLRREIQTIAVGSATPGQSERQTVYDALGRVAAVSTVQQAGAVDSTTKTTRYRGYDAFGRPSQILRADGRDERLAYKGERETKSTLAIRTTANGTTDVTTTTVRDGLGRTLTVDSKEYVTVSFYDPNSKVIAAERRRSGFTQRREYDWDNRGLLVSERHPEIGNGSGLGTVTFKPDVLGNPRETFDGLHRLTHEYDGDGRLTRIRQGGKVWKEQVWSNSNSGADRRKGKLIKAVRHNYPDGGSFRWAFAETYEYRGKLGQMSRRTTQLQWPSFSGTSKHGPTFRQDWTYDVLGDVESQTYPTCITTPENGRQFCNDPSDSPAPAHTVTRIHDQRLPVEVQSSLGLWAKYQYHWNYQTKRIDYSNGTHSILSQGTNGMRRPKAISHIGPSGSVLFATGDYQYDDAGNIWAIGWDRFVYDRASRLTYGTARSAARFEDYTYDAADNVRSVARDGGPASQFNITGKNRMLGLVGGPNDITYDGAGNLTGAGPTQVDYDALNMQARFFKGVAPTEEYLYAYSPGGFRILTLDVNNSTFHWSLRDLDGSVLREHSAIGSGHYVSPAQPGQVFTFEKDHVNGPNGLIATRDAAGSKRFFHHDHLGSTRAVSDVFGNGIGTQNYYPYGAPAVGSGAEERNETFTGHERDHHGLSYYMLARNYLYPWVRFGSVDPARASWNLYGYVSGNPVGRVDPTGMADESVQAEEIDFMIGAAITDGVQLTFKVNTIVGDELPNGNFEATKEFSLAVGFVGSVEINFAKDVVVGPVQLLPGPSGGGAFRANVESKGGLELNELRFGLLGVSLDAMSSGPGAAGFDSFIDSAETSFAFAPLGKGFDFVVPLSGTLRGFAEASRKGNAMRLERIKSGNFTRSDFQ